MKTVKVGDKIGRLTVVKKTENPNSKNKYARYWSCECECGNITITTEWQLNQNRETKSCGCWNNELSKERNTIHGDLYSKLYYIYRGMKGRCNNKRNPSYARYGGRGIKVCDEWNEYKDFKRWSEENGYEKGLTIDRIDNDGDYSPDNCRWTTILVQANNKRNSDVITFEGKAQTLSEWAREKGIKRVTLWARIYKYNWSIEKALTTLTNTGRE